MSKPPPKSVQPREYADQKELGIKADKVLKTISAFVEAELGSEVDGVAFMPALTVICSLKSDPATVADPVVYSVVRRPSSIAQIHDIVNNILLKDPVFLSSIMQGIGGHLAHMLSVHFDMTALVNSMEEDSNEETEIETNENKGKDPESQSNVGFQGYYKNSNEVN